MPSTRWLLPCPQRRGLTVSPGAVIRALTHGATKYRLAHADDSFALGVRCSINLSPNAFLLRITVMDNNALVGFFLGIIGTVIGAVLLHFLQYVKFRKEKLLEKYVE